jgi:hypothetical protein
MIVLLDTERLLIKIYSDSGLQTLAFDQADALKEMTKRGEKILYVTNGIATTADQVVDTVASFMEGRAANMRQSNEPLFLRSTLPGSMNIPGIYNVCSKKREDLIFNNPFDAKAIEEVFRDYGKDVFKKNRTMRSLLKKGKLQIIAESELEDMEARYKRGDLKISMSRADQLKHLKTMTKEEAENSSALEGDVKAGGPISVPRQGDMGSHERSMVGEGGMDIDRDVMSGKTLDNFVDTLVDRYVQ